MITKVTGNEIFLNDGTGKVPPCVGLGKMIAEEEKIMKSSLSGESKEDNKTDSNEELESKNNKKKKHEKRIPLEGEFMKTKYNDNVYGWLQCNSFADEIGNGEYRTLAPKYIINDKEPWKVLYSKFAPSGQRRKFRDEIKKFLKAGLIKETTYIKNNIEIECYELVYDYDELYYLIQDRVLEYLVNTKSVHSIRILCYLAFKYNNNKRYTFTAKELIKNCLGVKSITNNKDYQIVEDVLFDLEKSGFIGIDHNKYISLNDKATRVKQIKFLNMLPSDLKEYFSNKKR